MECQTLITHTPDVKYQGIFWYNHCINVFKVVVLGLLQFFLQQNRIQESPVKQVKL